MVRVTALFQVLSIFLGFVAWHILGTHALDNGEPQLAFSIQSNATTGDVVITPEISEYIEGLRIKWGIPGITLGVVHSGGEVELGAWGRKSEDGDEMTTDTLFNLASCSKAFAASAIGILIDDFAHGRNITPLPNNVQRLEWETKIIDLLPDDWELMDEWTTKKANIRDVLSHVSGLPRHDYTYRPADSPLDVIHRMRYLRTAFELRQRWSYNNQMYMLASYLVSKYSGIPYIDFIKTRIFDKISMTATTFYESEASRYGKLTQTWTKRGRRIPFWFPDEIAELKAGPGGIISSVEDMTHWVQTLLNSGIYPTTNTTVIPKDAFEETTGAHFIVGSSPKSADVSISGYGMGWERWSYHGYDVVSHSGGNPGFSTRVAFLPHNGLGIVILVNADEKGTPIMDLLYHIIDHWLGKDHNNVTSPDSDDDLDTKPLSSATGSAPPTLPLEAYAGNYSDVGYGNVTLCTPTTDTPHCKSVLQDFEPFPSPFGPDENPSFLLYAAHRTTYGSHLRLRHQDGDAFSITITYLFRNGYGYNKTAFETWESGEGEGVARFAVSDSGDVTGLGLFILDERTERRRLGGSVEDIADAWFVRV